MNPAEEKLDRLFVLAFDTNHPAMLDYATLKLELKALRADRERLDWIENNPHVTIHPDSVMGGFRVSCGPFYKSNHGPSVRRAIDAAINNHG